jgi:hypothetical protein
VTDGQVEIRYVVPTTPTSTKTQFCHLRTDYFHLVTLSVGHTVKAGLAGLVRLGGDDCPDATPPQVAPQADKAVARVSGHRVRA